MFLFKDILRLMLGSQVKARCKPKMPNRPEIGTGAMEKSMTTTVYAFAWGFGPARWAYSRKAARYERERIAEVTEVSNSVSAVWSLPLHEVLEDPNRYLYVGDLNWN